MKRSVFHWIVMLLCLAAGCDQFPLGGRHTAEVRVTSVPEGAAITFDGIVREAAPVSLAEVSPGTHLLVARKDGFHEARKTISVLADQRMAVEMKMEAVTGLVLVHSRPTGANVEVDGAYRGSTPLLIHDFPLGKHRLRLQRDGSLDKELDLTVADRTPRKVEVELISNTARLSVMTTPAGASVFVDGALLGVTPLVLDEVRTGKSTVELKLDGYVPYRREVRLRPGDDDQVRADLAPAPGTLAVVSVPDEARVYIDDQFRGTTPLTLADLEPKSYRVRVERPGYEVDARNVTVSAQESLTEEYRLVKNSGLLLMTTEPPGVKVYLDGKLIGATTGSEGVSTSAPLEVDWVPQGSHTLQLSKAGYHSLSRRIVVEPNKILSLHEKLVRKFIPDTVVRTGDGDGRLRKGVLRERLPNGDVRLEVSRGVIVEIQADEILEIKSLTAP